MRTSLVDQTYDALIEYASVQAFAQEFTVTQDRLLDWFAGVGLVITRRTLQTHTKTLCARGLLSTRYTGLGIVYSLPDGVVTIERMREVQIDEDVFVFESYTQLQSGNADAGYAPCTRVDREHARAMATLADFDPDW